MIRISQIFRNQKGFTLLEMLIVASIFIIGAGIAIFALNPDRQLSEKRNIQRETDVNTILNAVYQYAMDNQGVFPIGISGSPAEICATGASFCTRLIDLSVLTENQKYLISLPKDPQCPEVCDVRGIGYIIEKTSQGRILVHAPGAEQKKNISASK